MQIADAAFVVTGIFHSARPAQEFATLLAHIIENDYLNGEVIRLGGTLRMAPR